jgi:hypothetical protein
LELRERGVLYRQQSYRESPGRLAFTPWDGIAACKWCEQRPRCCVQTRQLLLDSSGLSTEEQDAITRAVARFVPVYDVEEGLIAAPESSARASDATLAKRSSGLKFQFSLQSLLLFTVVISCAASCYGIHSRHIQSQRAVVAQFDKFHPRVVEIGESVWSLDFSRCVTKPGDDDLVHLEPLQELEHLDLNGASITDAGLKHLYSLKKLERVHLWDTKVTPKGVHELQRTFPNAAIAWDATPCAAPAGRKK